MELRHLRYFVRVAEERHFGRAAAALGISQPPLSQQIRALEGELGMPLLDRTSRRVDLTEAGRLFLPEARAVLERAARAAELVRRYREGAVGALAIGFASSVPFIPAVAHAFAAYRAAQPAVRLTLEELSGDVQVDRLLDRSLDLGFVRGADQLAVPPGLVARIVVAEPLMVAVRADHRLAALDRPLGIDDLAGEPIIQYRWARNGGFNEHLAGLFRRRGQPFQIAQEVGGIATLLGLVAAGVGISFLPRSLEALHADGTVYRLLAEPDALSRLWLIGRRSPTATAQDFTALLPPPPVA